MVEMSSKPTNTKIKWTPFMAFMAKRRRELEAQGIVFRGGWKDVSNAVDSEWMVGFVDLN